MAVLPTPTGAPTLPDEATGSTYNEAYFQALFAKQWGSAAGSAYATYNKNHPQNSAYVNAENFLQIIVAEGLANGIKTAISTSGTALGQIPGAAAQGATNAYNSLNPLTGINAIGNFFNNLGNSNTWIRVAKVAVGGALLIIGLAHMTGATNSIATAARKAPLPI
jgi:hypothetical protein